KGIACLKPGDGSFAWHAQVADDIVGAPAVSGELVLVVHGRSLGAFDARKGSGAWLAESSLAGTPVLGPIAGPRGSIYVALRTELQRFDSTGAAQGEP